LPLAHATDNVRRSRTTTATRHRGAQRPSRHRDPKDATADVLRDKAWRLCVQMHPTEPDWPLASQFVHPKGRAEGYLQLMLSKVGTL
jgi:hypothetical protein